MAVASHWIKKGTDIQCLLCPHTCIIKDKEKGVCRVRVNEEGVLKTVNYGMITSSGLDHIEKKPLKKYMSGKMVFSIGTFGCNLSCGYCQNWTIAHGELPKAYYFSPEKIVEKAKSLVSQDNIGIAYTYSEPLMWFEYILDTAKLVKEAGMKNILVTNGYINPKPLKELLPYIDAVNLDVKAFTDEYYGTNCSGKLEPVLHSAQLMAQSCHLEITTLLVTGLNDSPQEIEMLAQWIASIDKEIPLHLTRYFPNYKMKLPPTPIDTLYLAKNAAEQHLDNVFLGNI